PDALEYKDFLILDKLPTMKGEPLTVLPGMIFEYWLEATDNSDYPNKDGNIGKSQSFKLLIQERPKDDKKQQEEKKRAQDEQTQIRRRQAERRRPKEGGRKKRRRQVGPSR